MGSKHKQLYTAADTNVLKRIKPGSYETADGRFASWAAGSKTWMTFDSLTGEQYKTVDKLAAIRLIVGIRAGVAPPAPVAPTPRPSAPAAEPQGQLQLVRPGQKRVPVPAPRIVAVQLLVGIEPQVVVGVDALGGVHKLWSAS